MVMLQQHNFQHATQQHSKIDSWNAFGNKFPSRVLESLTCTCDLCSMVDPAASDKSVQLESIRRLFHFTRQYYGIEEGIVKLIENGILPLLISFVTDETCSRQERTICFGFLSSVVNLGKDGREKAVVAGAIDALGFVQISPTARTSRCPR